MDTYEKKYKEALERAKGIHSFSSDIAEIKRMEQIFPELREREDERIRKAQLDYWRSVGGKEWHGVPVQEVIAWLEKQGEKKNVDVESLSKAILASHGDPFKKSKWSEEDKRMVGTLIAIFEVNYPDGFYKVNPIGTTDMQGIHSTGIIKWLKSIKQRIEGNQ